jgi:hypothetical protein
LNHDSKDIFSQIIYDENKLKMTLN